MTRSQATMSAAVASDDPNSPLFPHLLSQDACLELESFITDHISQSRPVALVTSGGTAADLEEHVVRSLENFSTGRRGAVSVELLLQKGYAVVHLWRIGSAAPYARALSEALDRQRQHQQPNHGLSTASFLNLLETEQQESATTATNGGDYNDDPWLDEDLANIKNKPKETNHVAASLTNSLDLNRRLVHDGDLRKAWRELKNSQGRLLTIPFRTIEEYLGRLEYCARALKPCQSLAMIYLAAAVSDFYSANKAKHKISSQSTYTTTAADGTSGDGKEEELVLKLQPVPKVMGVLRTKWCPSAFCVSFKLETDPTILRQKAQRAVDNYGVHLVVANILETRQKTVWLLRPQQQRDNNGKENSSAWLELTKPVNAVIETTLLDHVVEEHFLHIAKEHPSIATATQELMKERKRQLQREIFWKRLGDGSVQLGGTLLGMALTYIISMGLQRRIANAR